MTMIRPAELSITRWLLHGVSPKTLVIATLALAAPIYTAKSDIRHDEHMLDAQQGQVQKLDDSKVDKETYDRDVKSYNDTLNRMANSIEGIHQTLERR